MGGRKGSGVPFRVGGMQLSQLIYIIGANLALSRRVKIRWLSAIVVASQFRMEKSRNVDVFCRIRTCRYVFRVLKFYWGSYWAKYVGNIARTSTHKKLMHKAVDWL